MVQLVTRKTALVLYAVLLVLPTAVMGGLLWRQLRFDQKSQMAAVPGDVADAARRLTEGLKRRLSDLIERESPRPFYHYKPTYFPKGTIGAELAFVPSPLSTGPTPNGVLGWFSFPLRGKRSAPAALLSGGRDDSDAWKTDKDALARTVNELVLHDSKETPLRRLTRFGRFRTETLPMAVAAINMSTEDDVGCLRDELPALRSLQGEDMHVRVFDFHLRFYVEPDGTARALASRVVIIEANERLRTMPSCFDNLGWGATLVQGFYIDPTWLFGELPVSLATQVLDPAQEFFPAGSRGPPEGGVYEVAAIRPVKELGFETYKRSEEDFGEMKVAVNTGNLEARFRSQSLHYFGVAAMLIVSLVTGLVLLMRSVRRDLEAARRTENFVSAVTHELRTPLSAIRLYGEMLEDGWVEDPEKRAEYYRRIVRETGRLETLVEAVLEKGRLTSNEMPAEPGELNRVIENLAPSLVGVDDARTQDLELELASDLPVVYLIPDGLRSIVTNLVENARKYAPVAPGGEPIRLITRVAHDEVVLEVKDRGPGIPHAERSRIFEAFYRVGNETTRTAKGTGLGLHLVALQSAAMQARVQVLDRHGGGTVFRVTFRRADESVRNGQRS